MPFPPENTQITNGVNYRSTVPRPRSSARGCSRTRWTPSVPGPRLPASASWRGRRRRGMPCWRTSRLPKFLNTCPRTACDDDENDERYYPYGVCQEREFRGNSGKQASKWLLRILSLSKTKRGPDVWEEEEIGCPFGVTGFVYTG
jgi:hypothetical protein